jgi:hypothetical protein
LISNFGRRVNKIVGQKGGDGPQILGRKGRGGGDETGKYLVLSFGHSSTRKQPIWEGDMPF